MTRSTFNTLKSEYLAYFRDLTLLREVQAESRTVDKRYRSRSPEPGQKRKRATSPGRWEQKPTSPPPASKSDRWERKPLSPSPERPVRTYDDMEEDYPHGCIVFFKRFDPTTKTGTLKSLLQAVLDTEEIEPEKLQYVDHVRAVDSVSTSSMRTYAMQWLTVRSLVPYSLCRRKHCYLLYFLVLREGRQEAAARKSGFYRSLRGLHSCSCWRDASYRGGSHDWHTGKNILEQSAR